MGKGKKIGKRPVVHSEPLFTTQDDIEYVRQQQHSDTDTTDDDVIMEDESPEVTVYMHNAQPLDTQDSEEPQTQSTQDIDIDTQTSNVEDEVDEEVPLNAPGPSTSTKKSRKPAEDQVAVRRRTYYHIPEDKEGDLAEWYREQEFLYNKKLRAYRDRDRKARAWEEKGKALGVPGNTLEVWVKNMRTRYAKLIQTKSGQGARELTARDQWIVETFSFLRPHIVRCPTRTSKKSDGHGGSSTAASVDVAEDSDAPSHSSSARPRTPSATAGAPQPESAESIIARKLAESEKTCSDLMAQLTQQNTDNMQRRIIKEAHQLVATCLGDLSLELALQYMNDIIKLMLATRAKAADQHHSSATTAGPVATTAAPPGAVYHEMAAASSSPAPHPHATHRPAVAWGSATPMSGRPEATRRDDLGYSPNTMNTLLQSLTTLNNSPIIPMNSPIYEPYFKDLK